MIQRVIRYLFAIGALSIAVFVILDAGSYDSMLPQEYNILQRFEDKLKIIREERSQRNLPAEVAPKESIAPQADSLLVDSLAVDSLAVDTLAMEAAKATDTLTQQ